MLLGRSFEVHLLDLVVAPEGQQRVRAGLVAGPHTLDIKKLTEPAQAAVEVAAEPHEVLDVVEHREVDSDEVKEGGHVVRQVPAGEQPEQVPEVVPAVEGDPLHVGVEHDARRHEQLGEADRVGPLSGEPIEVDAAGAEHLDGVGVGRVGPGVEPAEVELPDAAPAPRPPPREVAALVGEGEAELDELEHVDVGLEVGVVELVGGTEVADGAAHDARELRVHGDVRVPVDLVADRRDLRLQVPRPYLPDLHALVGALYAGCGGGGHRRIQRPRVRATCGVVGACRRWEAAGGGGGGRGGSHASAAGGDAWETPCEGGGGGGGGDPGMEREEGMKKARGKRGDEPAEPGRAHPSDVYGCSAIALFLPHFAYPKLFGVRLVFLFFFPSLPLFF